MDQAGTEDEGEEPEDDDEEDLDKGHEDEKDDIDWDRELEGVDQVEIGQGLVVQVQNICRDNTIALLVFCVVPKVYVSLCNSLDVPRLLIVVDVDLDNRRETICELVRVECHWEQFITTVIDQSLVRRLL